MPIKNLTNRGLAFPEIGQIRKGAPKDDQGKLGKDLQYFRAEFAEGEVDAAKTFEEAYGSEPNEINILLPFNDINTCWEAWLEAYTAGRMVARSDGEKFDYLIDTGTGEVLVKNGIPFKAYEDGMSVGSYQDSKGDTQQIYCKETGRLKVVIPELQRLAYVTVMTSSKHDISNLDAQLSALKQINEGIIAGIPMVLRRRPKKISTPKEDGTRARYTKWMLSIEADPEWVKHKLTEFQALALPENLLITEGEIIDDDEDQVEDQVETAADIPAEEPELKRPYPAEYVRKKINVLAETSFKDQKIQKKRNERVGLMVGMIEECFAGDGDSSAKRHELCWYLTSYGSSKTMPDNYILALLSWISAEQDSGGAWHPGPHVQEEAQKILLQRLQDLGQGKLI